MHSIIMTEQTAGQNEVTHQFCTMTSGNRYILVVSDNGIGLPGELRYRQPQHRWGLRIVGVYWVKQLERGISALIHAGEPEIAITFEALPAVN
jgi:two-component sensor histidine kinase